MKLKKRTLKIILIILLGISVIFTGMLVIGRIMLSKRANRIVGTYLVAGGESYITIDKTRWGRPYIKEGTILGNYRFSTIPISSKIYIEKDRLFIEQKNFILGSISPDGGLHENDNNIIFLSLRSAGEKRSDWHLEDAEITSFSDYRIRNLFGAGLGDFLVHVSHVKHFLKNITSIYKKDIYFSWKLPPKTPPLKSYLHKVHDPGLIPVVQNLSRGIYPKESLDVVQQISSQDPGDPWIDLLQAELEARQGNIEKAEEILSECKSKQPVKDNIFLSKTIKRVNKTIQTNKLNKKCGRPLQTSYIIEEYPSSGITDSCLFTGEPHLYYFKYYPYMYPFRKTGILYEIPDYQGITDSIKVNKVITCFKLLEGKSKETRKSMKRYFCLGSSLISGEEMFTQIWGCSLRNIVTSGLEIQILNACEDPKEQEEMWSLLEDLNWIAMQIPESVSDGDYGILVNLFLDAGKFIYTPPYAGYNVLLKNVSVRFQILRVAGAAKFIYLQYGKFPESEEDFREYFPEGIPEDPFNKTESLKYFLRDDNTFTIYSLGPDEDDDGASVLYDHWNSTSGNGDIYLDIPVKRIYPFPPEGLKANNAADVLEQFPNGLPEDIYADTNGRPLSILESNGDHPVIIFSWGPDKDEKQSGVITHDPSNKEPPNPVSTPEPPQDLSPGRKLQRIFLQTDSDEEAKDPAYWKLEPQYDPTNGLDSNGDIYIQIPPKSDKVNSE